MMPLMWAEERVRVTEEIAASIALVPLFVMLGQIVTGVLLAGGLICTCWYPTRQLTRLCYSDDPKAKASVLCPLTTTFGRSEYRAPSVPPMTVHHTSGHNERVGVRLVDYRRSSGLEQEQDQSSVSDCLINSSSTDVIIS